MKLVTYWKIPWSFEVLLEWVQNGPVCCLLAGEQTKRYLRTFLVVLPLPPPLAHNLLFWYRVNCVILLPYLISVCNRADKNFIVCGSQWHVLYLRWIWLRKNLIRKPVPFGGCAKDQDAYLFLHWTKCKSLFCETWRFTSAQGSGLTRGAYFLGHPNHLGSAVDLLSHNLWGWDLDTYALKKFP